MLGVGGESMVGVDELEREIQEGEEREKRRTVKEAAVPELMEADDASAAFQPSSQGTSMFIDLSTSSGQTSEDEIARSLVHPASYGHEKKPLRPHGGPRASERTALPLEDDDVDGMHIDLASDDDEASNLVHPDDNEDEGITEEPEVPSLTPDVTSKSSETPGGSQGSQTGDGSNFRLLSDFWRDNVSRIHLPRYWLDQDPVVPTPPSADPALPAPARPLGCTLTLTLPDDSTRTFTVPTSTGHTTRKSVKNAAAGLVLASPELLEEVKKQREQLGPEDEAAEKVKVKRARGENDKSYDKLLAASQKWMVVGDIKWEFATDELNAAHGCTLRVPVTASDTRSYAVEKVHHSHREAKEAAARLALDSGVLKLWEQCYQERMKTDSGGYITFSAAAEEAGTEGKDMQDGRVGYEEDGTVNPILLVGEEAKAAFGPGLHWLSWSHNTVLQPGASGTLTEPRLSGSLTINFPKTAANPNPPSPLNYSTPHKYLTKHHAYTACANAALKDGIVEKLRPYREEREAEKEKKAEERARDREEKKVKASKPLPKAGTVKWEDLATLDNPVAYLNQCAQIWTGNGSPLKFEYVVEDGDGVPGKKRPKYHGCSFSVVISSTLTKIYRILPSASTPNKASAKDAAIRLAFREHVLDLMMPAAFDPDGPGWNRSSGSDRKTGRKEKRAEKKKAVAGGPHGKGVVDGAPNFIAPTSRSAPASLVNGSGGGEGHNAHPNSAVGYLDRFCQEWLGAGGLPTYDVRQNRSGYFGAVLRIPIPSFSPHIPPLAPKTYWVDFAHPDRSSAQEAVANVAVRDRVIDQLKVEVPLAPTAGHAAGGFAMGVTGGRGMGIFGGAQPAPVLGGFGTYGAAGSKRAAPSPASSAQAMAFANTAEPAQKKQRVWGAPASESDREEEDDEEGKEVEQEETQKGSAISNLFSGLRAKLGDELSVRPQYKVVEKDSLFGASVAVPLSTQANDTRTFRVPPICPSKALARAAAAQAAMTAGVLDLLESRSRVPVLNSSPKQQQQRGRQAKLAPEVKTPEEQEQARKRAYGGLGGAAAAVVVKQAASPLAAKSLMPIVSALAPTGGMGTGSVQAKGKSVVALESHCRANSLPAPVFTHLKEGEKRRVFVVVKDLRFELPKLPEKPGEAEERLALKVLKHLQKISGDEKARENGQGAQNGKTS
ncbi:hypothetical protein JCM11251_003518 [Rhodosporidiobolus azoricus]